MATACNALSSLTESVNAKPSTISSCPQRLVWRIIGKMDVSWGQETVLSRGKRTRAVAARYVHCRSSPRLAGLCRVNMLAAIDVAREKSRGGRFWFELAGHREA